MKNSVLQTAVFAALLAAMLGYLHLISHARFVAGMSAFLRSWAFVHLEPSDEEYELEAKQTLDRVETYLKQINKGHLLDGMLVNRYVDGDLHSKCDSLLFTSLYYVSLRKLGKHDEATEVWKSIEKSRNAGHWYRHPQCRKSTSRDMIVGLLSALSQKPSHYRLHLKAFLGHLARSRGYVSNGPFYVSYLSPGLAEIVRKFARNEGIAHRHLPPTVRSAFSTLEIDATMSKPGYTSHLIALTTWIEWEIAKHERASNPELIRSPAQGIEGMTKPFLLPTLYQQRLDYVTQSLVDTDPKNLFFRYLRYRSAGAFSKAVRLKLLKELNAMTEFPATRLPNNCDRKADYLWQRGSHEYAPKGNTCRIVYNGLDYIWMASLLMNDEDLDSRDYIVSEIPKSNEENPSL